MLKASENKNVSSCHLKAAWNDVLRMDSLSGISPPYLADDCRLVTDARERRLRSTASRTCVVTRTYSAFGDRAFGAAGPGLWNSLSSHLKDADISYSEFWRSLKTFLFGQWGHGAVWTLLTAPTRNILTYLLLTRAGGSTQPDPRKRKLSLQTWYAAAEERSLSIQPYRQKLFLPTMQTECPVCKLINKIMFELLAVAIKCLFVIVGCV